MTTTKSTTDGFRAAAEYVRQLEETNARLKEEVEQADRHAKAVEANFVRTVAKLTRENDRLKDENTPLEGIVRSAIRLLGRYLDEHIERGLEAWSKAMQGGADFQPMPEPGCACVMCNEARDIIIAGKRLLKAPAVDRNTSDSAPICKPAASDNPQRSDQPNCRACAYSYMEPDSDLTCGHPDAGTFGLTIRIEPLAHCGWKKFEQHPQRNPDGSLK